VWGYMNGLWIMKRHHACSDFSYSDMRQTFEGGGGRSRGENEFGVL